MGAKEEILIRNFKPYSTYKIGDKGVY